MESSATASILVVAHRTAATAGLADAVRHRAGEGPGALHAAGPPHRARPAPPRRPRGAGRVRGPRDLDQALPILSEAAGAPVEGMIGDPTPLTAIEDAVNAGHFDEIILSTLPATISKWLKLDLPSKVTGLGLPVTTVTAVEAEASAVG